MNSIMITLKKIWRQFKTIIYRHDYFYVQNWNDCCDWIGYWIEVKNVFISVDNSQHKKVKGMNRNAVTTISHNEYKDVLLNKKFLRHSMNRIESKQHRIGTYEINRISLSWFDDKIFI